MTQLFSNAARSELALGITGADATITLAAGDGALFPALAPGDWFYLTLQDGQNNIEIVKAVARAGDVLTVLRGQQGTAARAFDAGTATGLRITADDALAWSEKDDPLTGPESQTFTRDGSGQLTGYTFVQDGANGTVTLTRDGNGPVSQAVTVFNGTTRTETMNRDPNGTLISVTAVVA